MSKKNGTGELLGITLISAEEKLCYQPYPEQMPQVKIYYRRLDDNVRRQWDTELTTDDRSGKVNANALGERALKYGALSWEGVYGADKQPAPLTVQNLQSLDRWILDELLTRINGIKRGFIQNPLAG